MELVFESGKVFRLPLCKILPELVLITEVRKTRKYGA
jgi:hypothetical protein